MVKQAKYIALFRRRREGKTNYRRRKKAVVSRRPLLYVFVSGKNTSIQIISPRTGGDKVLASASSRELLGFGWKSSRRSIPGAYLTGLLLGARATSAGIKDAILYTNVRAYHSGGRMAAAVKGIVDAGFKLPVGEESLPKEDRVSGKHVAEFAAKLKETDADRYKSRFSSLLKAGVKPEELPLHFEAAKAKILKVKAEK
ncbi:MAG: 50S ribosomal protein L18 [Conexivisphaerales archaeon]